jgi:lysophospholipase L1-like esterase
MRRFIGVIICCLGWNLVADEILPTNPNFEKEIADFEESDRTNFPPSNPILFTGSSSIRLWSDLKNHFPEHQVVNRGFGGSHLIDSVYFAERIIIPYKPKQVVIYAGGNDINSGKTAEKVFADFKLLVRTIHEKLPQTRISYISIAPNPARWKQIDRVRRANRMIKIYSGNKLRVDFIDVHTHMLEDGEPKPGIFQQDRLHMNDNGYSIWRKIISAKLVGSSLRRSAHVASQEDSE